MKAAPFEKFFATIFGESRAKDLLRSFLLKLNIPKHKPIIRYRPGPKR